MANTEAPDVLPTWDLTDLYSAPDSDDVQRDVRDAAAVAESFTKSYQGRIAALQPGAFSEAIRTYEAISETLGRVASYAQLLHAGDLTDPNISKFAQDIREQLNNISTDLIFFTLEINRLDDAALEVLVGGGAEKYRPWIDNVRAHRDHELADDVEKLFHEKAVTSSSAWSRLFDETLAASRYSIGDEHLTLEETLNCLSSPDRAKRREASEALAATFESKAPLFALVTNSSCRPFVSIMAIWFCMS